MVNRLSTGGVKSLLLNYLNAMDKDRFEIHFVVCESGSDLDREAVFKAGGKVLEVGPISHFGSYIAGCRKLFTDERYDIVQACMNSLNVFPLAAAWLARTPVRISYNLSTAHPGERKTLVKNALRPFGRAFATNYAANSSLAWRWLFGAPRSGDGGSIIPNAVDVDSFAFDLEARECVRRELGLSDCYVIGHIGRYEYQKNHSFLVDVFEAAHQANPKARLVLVGYGSLKDEVFRKIDRCGLTSYVIDLGATEDIAKLYSCFDCFVLPSFYEGMPVVGVEAQAASCPCVFSDEVTEETNAGGQVLFLPLDSSPAEWAAAVLGFAGTARPASEEERVAAKFGSFALARRLERYYERLSQASSLAETRKIEF